MIKHIKQIQNNLETIDHQSHGLRYICKTYNSQKKKIFWCKEMEHANTIHS